MTSVVSNFIKLTKLFHVVNNEWFLSPNLRDPESEQRKFLFAALELKEEDTKIKDAIVDVFYLLRSLTIQRHMRFKQLKDDSVKDHFSYDLSKIDEYMYRIVEKADTQPNTYLFLQYTLALLEICKQGQLSKIYPYKENTSSPAVESKQPSIIPFIRNLSMKDVALVNVKVPSMYSPYKAQNTTLPSPIQFESYIEQRDRLGDNRQLKQKLSVYYFIMMMTSMAFIPDPDYMKLVFGETNYTSLNKQALDELGYCGIPTQIKQYQKLVRSIIAVQILKSTESVIPNVWNQEVKEYDDWFKNVSQTIYPLEGGTEQQDPFAVYTVMRMYTTYIHCLNEHRNEATRKKFEALQFPWGVFYQKVEKKTDALREAERYVNAAEAEVAKAETDVNAAEEEVNKAEATLLNAQRRQKTNAEVAAAQAEANAEEAKVKAAEAKVKVAEAKVKVAEVKGKLVETANKVKEAAKKVLETEKLVQEKSQKVIELIKKIQANVGKQAILKETQEELVQVRKEKDAAEAEAAAAEAAAETKQTEPEQEFKKVSLREVLQASIDGKAFTEDTFKQGCNLWRLSLIQHYISPATYVLDRVGPFQKDFKMMNVNRAQYRLEKSFYQDVVAEGFDFLRGPFVYTLDRLLPMKIHKDVYMTLESPKKRGQQSFGIQVKRNRIHSAYSLFSGICNGFLKKQKDSLSDLERMKIIRYIQSIKSLNQYFDYLHQTYVPYDIVVNAIGELIIMIRKRYYTIINKDYKNITSEQYNDLLKGKQPSEVRTLTSFYISLSREQFGNQHYLLLNYMLMPHYRFYNEEKSLPGELDKRIVGDDVCHSPSIVFLQEYAVPKGFISLYRDVLMTIPKSVVEMIPDPSVEAYVNFGVWFNHIIHKVMKNRIRTSSDKENPILSLEQTGGDRSGEVVKWNQSGSKNINLNSVKQFYKDGFKNMKRIMEDQFFAPIISGVDTGDAMFGRERILNQSFIRRIQKEPPDSELSDSEKNVIYWFNKAMILRLQTLKQKTYRSMMTKDWIHELVPTLIPTGSIRKNV